MALFPLPQKTMQKNKKKLIAAAVAATAISLGFTASDYAEAADTQPAYHSASPLKAQRAEAEKNYEAQKGAPVEEAKAPAYQMVDVDSEKTPSEKVFPTDGSYSSPSPLKAQRELANKHALEYKKQVEAMGKDGKKHTLKPFKVEHEVIESEPFDVTFVYDSAPVYNNRMNFQRSLHMTIHAEDAIDEHGTLGKYVSITRDYVREWKESSVSRVPLLGTKTEDFFFPGEQGKKLDMTSLSSELGLSDVQINPLN